MIDFLLEIFRNNRSKDAIIWNEKVFSYEWLLQRIGYWRRIVASHDIAPSAVTVIEADFSPNSVALFLTLVEHGCILVPLTSSVESQKPDFIAMAQGEVSFVINDDDSVDVKKLPFSAEHDLYQILKKRRHPGLVLFSSGSTGKSKAALHDFVNLLDKFRVPRHGLRTITFLLYDHIGGVNTLLYTLSNAGCVISVFDRSPEGVFRAIERHRVELLPTSPTFINMIILSEVYQKYDSSSLKTITYGTEPMPESTLKRIHRIFPDVRLQQTYGLSELGILRSKSKDPDSLWVRVGGEGYETKIVDGILWIRAKSAMLGYLNAPTPFDEDGWFNTGDVVEQEGEYLRILGRESEIINVGGEKVYPIEVESVIQTMEGVDDVSVSGEPNPIVGQIVKARIKLNTDESLSEYRKRMRAFCRDKLANFKVPQKVEIVATDMHGQRFKKMRRE